MTTPLLRVLAGTALLTGGVLGAINTALNGAIVAVMMSDGGDFGALYPVLGIVAPLAIGLFALGEVLSALSRSPGGVSGPSPLPTVAWFVIAVVTVTASIVQRMLPVLGMSTTGVVLMTISISQLAVLAFVAIAMAARTPLGGPARWALFLPLGLGIVAAFSGFGGMTTFYVVQTLASLAWAFVGLAYLLAKPRVRVVTPASGDLAEW